MAKITLREIAEKANVSIGTVDRCLHDRGKVNEETARRIREICATYGYESNVVGKAMALQRKGRTVAVVINASERNNFCSIIHRGVEDYAASVEDYNVKYVYYDLVDGSVSELCHRLEEVYQSDADALIVKPIDSPLVKYHLSRIAGKKGIPIVFCTSDIEGVDNIAYVGQNHEKLGRMLACTLTKVAHEPLKILVFVGPLTSSARREKLEGFMQYMAQSGREYDILSICEVSFDEAEAEKMIGEYLELNSGANAIYVHTPQIRPCAEALDCFRDFKGLVFGYGEASSLGDYIRSGRFDFAVYEDPYRQGYLAAETIFNYLLNGEVPENRNVYLDGSIVFDVNC